MIKKRGLFLATSSLRSLVGVLHSQLDELLFSEALITTHIFVTTSPQFFVQIRVKFTLNISFTYFTTITKLEERFVIKTKQPESLI